MEEFLAMYKERTTTKAQDIGRLGQETVSSRRKHDARTSDNTGGAEMAAYAKQHGHAQSSAELSKANDEYKARQQASAIRKFRSIDADGSGTLDREEVLAGAKILDLTEDQASSLFDELDADGSGDVDMEEFLAVYQERATATKADDIGRLGQSTESSRRKQEARTADNTGAAELAEFAKAHDREMMSAELQKGKDAFKVRQQRGAIRKFRSIDVDGSGTLDIEEVLLGAPILKLGEEQARAWFSDIDKDGSGEIDMEEFLAYYAKNMSTVTQDIGSLGADTATSRRRNDILNAGYNANNTGDAELANYNRVNAKEIMSKALDQAKDDWHERMKSAGFEHAEKRAKAVKMFTELDADGNGMVDIDEVAAGAGFLNLTPEEARSWFVEIDVYKRGEVSINEFLNRFQQIVNGFIPKPTDVEKFKSAAEVEAKENADHRESMSKELASAKEQWHKRRAKNGNRSHTVPDPFSSSGNACLPRARSPRRSGGKALLTRAEWDKEQGRIKNGGAEAASAVDVPAPHTIRPSAPRANRNSAASLSLSRGRGEKHDPSIAGLEAARSSSPRPSPIKRGPAPRPKPPRASSPRPKGKAGSVPAFPMPEQRDPAPAAAAAPPPATALDQQKKAWWRVRNAPIETLTTNGGSCREGVMDLDKRGEFVTTGKEELKAIRAAAQAQAFADLATAEAAVLEAQVAAAVANANLAKIEHALLVNRGTGI